MLSPAEALAVVTAWREGTITVEGARGAWSRLGPHHDKG